MNREQALGYAQVQLRNCVESEKKAADDVALAEANVALDAAVKWSQVVLALRAVCS